MPSVGDTRSGPERICENLEFEDDINGICR